VAITAEKLRELVATGERPTLDFKVKDYDWQTKGNAELAKDLMAMANILGPSAAPAYILIGVENDGSIVGINPASHIDDAALHQKVRDLLNKTPRFTYSSTEIDEKSIGVYEILPNGRPFFPLRDSAPLMKFVPMYRPGTNTERASPTMVLDWYHEDNATTLKIQSLELDKLEAERAVHATIAMTHKQLDGDTGTILWQIRNTGRSGFVIRSSTWRLEWPEDYLHGLVDANTGERPESCLPPSGLLQTAHSGRLPPLEQATLRLDLSRKHIYEHIKKQGIRIMAFELKWATYHCEIHCKSDLGGEGVVTSKA
jgi:hypothetical protein